VAVRIELWVTQFRGNAFFKSLRDEMFQAFRFFVNLFQRVLQDFVEKCFDQAMMAQHLKRSPSARQPTGELLYAVRTPREREKKTPAFAAYW
jgi:hypothetical protein